MNDKYDLLEEYKRQTNRLVSEVKEWNADLRGLLSDYHRDADTLKQALDVVQKQKKSLLYVYRRPLGIGVASLLILLGVVALINKTDFCGTVELPYDVSYVGKECT